MALNAGDARVRRILMGRELRLHHGVACLSAELHGLHVVHGRIAELASDYDVDRRGGDYETGQTPDLDATKVERVGERHKAAGRSALSPALDKNAQRNQ